MKGGLGRVSPVADASAMVGGVFVLMWLVVQFLVLRILGAL